MTASGSPLLSLIVPNSVPVTVLPSSPPVFSVDAPAMVTALPGNPLVSTSFNLSSQLVLCSTGHNLTPTNPDPPPSIPSNYHTTGPRPTTQSEIETQLTAHHPQPSTSRPHQMTTRSMNKIFKPKQLNNVTKHPIPDTIEPTCVNQVVSEPHWRKAMSHELTALMRHGTWELVPPPKHCNPIGCKWVFRVKRKSDGTVDRFKARLVAKVYHQRPGVDYTEKFSPVVKPATIRIILSIAMMNGWDINQLDINNAFFYGALNETVYMLQPPGFKDSNKPGHVCQLRKAIYGLKQAPRAWYSALKNAILHFGFKNSHADSSLFIFQHESIVCYFLVYMDDLVITGNNSDFVNSIVKQLGCKFSLKDMGSLHYFLGMEVIPIPRGLFLSQHKYIRDLLSNTNMLGAKEVCSPLSTSTPLKLNDDTTSFDSIEYRRIIGSLQYLSLT